MKTEQFNEIVEQQCKDILDRCGVKAAEYVSQDDDRLGNFKRAAALLGCTPERALSCFVAKHITATYDFIRDLEAGRARPMSQWDEKIGDIILYMILLKGLLIERSKLDV